MGKIEYYSEKYYIGVRVHKYYGFKHLYLSPLHNNDGKTCIVCGTTNKDHDTVNGTVAEMGSHKELIKKDGPYKEIYNIQAKKYY